MYMTLHKLGFLERNTSIFIISGFRHDLLGVTIVLKSLSDDVLVAQMHKYFLANTARTGKFWSWDCHHRGGSDSASDFGD